MLSWQPLESPCLTLYLSEAVLETTLAGNSFSNSLYFPGLLSDSDCGPTPEPTIHHISCFLIVRMCYFLARRCHPDVADSHLGHVCVTSDARQTGVCKRSVRGHG